jgi:AbrB family looped-hinge helix DNA binding protein
MGDFMTLHDNSVQRAKTKLNSNGRIVIPAAIREALNIKPGDTLLLEASGGVLRIESFERKLREIQNEIIRLVGPDRSLADELIAERREEARREQMELESERSISPDSLRKAG